MIIVEVRLHSAITKKVTVLQTLVIDNVGTNEDGSRADYRARVMRKGEEYLDLAFGKVPIRQAKVENHARKSKPILNLVYKALVKLGYDK